MAIFEYENEYENQTSNKNIAIYVLFFQNNNIAYINMRIGYKQTQSAN